MAGSTVTNPRKSGSFKRLQGIAGTGGLNQGTGGSATGTRSPGVNVVNPNAPPGVTPPGGGRPQYSKPVITPNQRHEDILRNRIAAESALKTPTRITGTAVYTPDATEAVRGTGAPAATIPEPVRPSVGGGMVRGRGEAPHRGNRTGVEVTSAGGTPIRVDNNQALPGQATQEQAQQIRTLNRNSIDYDRQQDPEEVAKDATELAQLRQSYGNGQVTDETARQTAYRIKELEQSLEESYAKNPALKEVAAKAEIPLNTNYVEEQNRKTDEESKVYAEKRQQRVDKLHADIANQEAIIQQATRNGDFQTLQQATRTKENLVSELKGMGEGIEPSVQSTQYPLTSSSGIGTSAAGLSPEQAKTSGITVTPGAGAKHIGGQSYYDRLPVEAKQAADDMAAINAEQQKAHDAGDSRRFYDLEKLYKEAEASYKAASGDKRTLLRAYTPMPISEDTGQTTTLDRFQQNVPTHQGEDATAAATAERKARMAEYQKLIDEPYDTYEIQKQYDNNIQVARRTAARNKALALKAMMEQGAESGASVNQMMGQTTEAGYGYDVNAQQEEAKLGLAKSLAVQQSIMQQTQNKINAAQAALSIAANAEEAAKARQHVSALQAQQARDQAKLMELQQELNTPSTGMQIAGLGIQAIGALGALYTGGASMVAANALNNQIQGSAPGTQANATNFNYTSAPGTTDSWNTGRSGNASIRLG